MNSTHVAVLRGGPSTEHEISMQSGAGVLSALKNASYTTKDVTISKAGEWLVDGYSKTPDQALSDIDVVFIALHGQYGEDGTVQRILDRLAIPYTGSGALASGIAMNKALTKDTLKEHGIAMAKHMRISSNKGNYLPVAQTLPELLQFPCIVKPLTGGSSIDTQIVGNIQELISVLQNLFGKYEEVLVEELVVGKEATVGIVERFRDHEYYRLPEIEIVPPSEKSFFDAEVKYNGKTEEICPGRFSKTEKEKLATAAELIHRVLNLTHYSRSDFIIKDGVPYFLEVNTLPGLTAESLLPKSFEAVGSSYSELVTHLVNLAISTRR